MMLLLLLLLLLMLLLVSTILCAPDAATDADDADAADAGSILMLNPSLYLLSFSLLFSSSILLSYLIINLICVQQHQ